MFRPIDRLVSNIPFIPYSHKNGYSQKITVNCNHCNSQTETTIFFNIIHDKKEKSRGFEFIFYEVQNLCSLKQRIAKNVLDFACFLWYVVLKRLKEVRLMKSISKLQMGKHKIVVIIIGGFIKNRWDRAVLCPIYLSMKTVSYFECREEYVIKYTKKELSQ